MLYPESVSSAALRYRCKLSLNAPYNPDTRQSARHDRKVANTHTHTHTALAIGRVMLGRAVAAGGTHDLVMGDPPNDDTDSIRFD